MRQNWGDSAPTHNIKMDLFRERKNGEMASSTMLDNLNNASAPATIYISDSSTSNRPRLINGVIHKSNSDTHIYNIFFLIKKNMHVFLYRSIGFF